MDHMNEVKQYMQNLFAYKKLLIPTNRKSLFEEFVGDDKLVTAVNQIIENQKWLMGKWELKNRINDIMEQAVSIPNGTVGKLYKATLDFPAWGWKDIVFSAMEGLEAIGLQYDNNDQVISGTPLQSGDIKIKLKFNIAGEEPDSKPNEKVISLVINPDPKSLWKNNESDKNDPYWKEDSASAFETLGDKHIVVASKRGRSHANTGSFRDDDFAFKHYSNNGWSIIAVADGAGSAKLAREGSRIACMEIVEHFEVHFTEEVISGLDSLLKEHNEKTGEDAQGRLNTFVYNILGKAVFSIHKKLQDFANLKEVPLKDLHSTLIFALLKKYDFGYAIISFGVGDCPIGLLNKDVSQIFLMNWLDVGEFGGGTRFITMPEIFQSDKFYTRFSLKIVDDFSYLMLMTDGIYDPKFVVEANLEKIEKWQEFLSDLNGNNEDNAKVEFNAENNKIAEQLSAWMDFWSSGNHDDRTLAIVF